MFLVYFFLFLSPNVWAFKINLMDSNLELGQGKYSTTATIVNDSENKIAIEAGARIRDYNLEGVENFDQLAEDLIVIPSQMIIPPNSEQVINIRWTGPKKIPTERAYRLLIEYVSISEDKLLGQKPDEQQAGININYRIAKSFYVTPKGVKPNVTVKEASINTVENKEFLHLSFENLGHKHQIANVVDMTFLTDLDNAINLSFQKEDLGGTINFLPLQKREVKIPVPPQLQGKIIKEAVIVNITK